MLLGLLSALLLLLIAMALVLGLAWQRERQKHQQTQAALTQATQRLAIKDQLTTRLMGDLAHELRTPLNSILGFSRLMARDGDMPDAHRHNLNIINRNGAHLLDLINDILDFSKIEAGRVKLNPVPFELGRFLDDVSLLVIDGAHSKKLRFNPMIESGVRGLWIETDKDKLRQVLLNLLTNAIKYADVNHVTLGVRVVTQAQGQEMLRIDVHDSGPGIPEDKMPLLFQPFERLNSASSQVGGTGLGLAITKSLVELMQGSISAANAVEDGGGSRFTVMLPLVRVEAREQPAQPRMQAIPYRLTPGQAPCKVLVVDDDDDSRALLVALLTGLGFEVQEASDCAQALTTFASWRPRFVWMDLQLPDMNGRDAVRILRGLPGGADAAVAALTAYAPADQRADILHAGFDALLLKPFRDEEVLGTMQSLLGVTFDYRQVAEAAKVYVQLNPRELADLPPELVSRMLVTVGQSHNQHMHELIDLMPVEKTALAKEMRLLVDACEWDRLGQWLEAVPKPDPATDVAGSKVSEARPGA